MSLALAVLGGCSLGEPPPLEAPPPTAPPVQHLLKAPGGPPDWTVDCSGGGDFTTIGAAIAAATPRQFIEVWPCTYNEDIDYSGKALWIAGRDGSATTIIDGGPGTVVAVESGESVGTALVGFTVTGGTSQAIDILMSALYLQDIVLTGNSGTSAIRSLSGDLKMADVTIDASNTSTLAAVYSDKGGVVMTRSTVECGSGAAVQAGHGAYLIDWSTLTCLGNDPVFETENGVGRIMRSNLHGNVEIVQEDDHPDDLLVVSNSLVRGDIDFHYGTFELRNAVVTGTVTVTDTGGGEIIENTAFIGSVACAIDGATAPATVRNNDFWGPTTARCDGAVVIGNNGNIAVDPQFVDLFGGDLHLTAGSALIDAGVGTARHNDVDGTRNDIGLFGGRFSQDGGW